MDISEKHARLRLFRTQGIGPSTFSRLIKKYGTAQAAITALPDLAAKGGRQTPLIACSIKDIEKEWKDTLASGAEFIFQGEKDYPNPLSQIPDAPPILITRGFKDLLNKPIISIVGSRNASTNSKRLAYRFAEVLGEQGFVIASGMAKGIDRASHEGAMSSGTIGVIAGGIDTIYPKENKDLYEETYNRGLVVTEYAYGSPPQARQFPKRNRIITGLSQGVLVVEAALKSGTLISAQYALEQGRDVFAVPGSPLDARNRGANDLIRQGAILTETPDDIFNNIRPVTEFESENTDYLQPNMDDEITTEEQRLSVLQCLGDSPTHVDSLIRDTGLLPSILFNILLELEVAGRIERLSGNRVSPTFELF